MGLGAILLDAGAIADQALGRHAVNLLQGEARGRINGLYTGGFFLGGALGSAVLGVVWAHAGWTGVYAAGVLDGSIALAIDLRGDATQPVRACD